MINYFKMPTPKQAIAPMKISEAGDKGKGLLAAGYSKSVSETPALVTESKGYKEAAKPYVDMLVKLRDKAAKRADATVDKASYADAMRSTDIYTKQIQLLSGEATSRDDKPININISGKELDEALQKAIKI